MAYHDIAQDVGARSLQTIPLTKGMFDAGIFRIRATDHALYQGARVAEDRARHFRLAGQADPVPRTIPKIAARKCAKRQRALRK